MNSSYQNENLLQRTNSECWFSTLSPNHPELAEAAGADALALEDGYVPAAVAEDAGGAVLLEHDGGAVHENFHGLPLSNG